MFEQGRGRRRRRREFGGILCFLRAPGFPGKGLISQVVREAFLCPWIFWDQFSRSLSLTPPWLCSLWGPAMQHFTVLACPRILIKQLIKPQYLLLNQTKCCLSSAHSTLEQSQWSCCCSWGWRHCQICSGASSSLSATTKGSSQPKFLYPTKPQPNLSSLAW